jgi:hypothetical protein
MIVFKDDLMTNLPQNDHSMEENEIYSKINIFMHAFHQISYCLVSIA